MATITLDDGESNTLSLPIKYPEEPSRTYPMLVGGTMGGRIITADLSSGTSWEQPVLHFRRLTQTQFNNLKTYIESTIRWSEESVTYTDADGVAHTNMHYISGLEGARRINDRWDVDIVLRKNMSP